MRGSRESSPDRGGGGRRRGKSSRDTRGDENNRKKKDKPYAKQLRQSQSHSQTKVVEVSGLGSARNEDDLITFLRTYTEFSFTKTFWTDGCLYIDCGTLKEAQGLRKSTGLTYNTRQLNIRFANNVEAPRNRASLIDVLTKLVRSRYDTASRFLDLEKLVDDPLFVTTGSKGFNNQKKHGKQESNFGPVLCKLIGTICPDVQSISFASNRIVTLKAIVNLSSYVPDLVNLSLKNNEIRTYDDLNHIKGIDFPCLRELVLEGNPVRTKELEKAGGEINLKSNIKSLFPSLKLIDGASLLDEIKFGIDDETKLPISVKTGFSDDPGTLAMAQQFYEYFDNNRQALENFYEDASCFSLSIANTSNAFRGDAPKPELLFRNWWPFNRSLNRVTQADKRCNLIHYGAKNILEIFQILPETQHPLHEPPEKKKFVFDTFQQGVQPAAFLYIFVHGEFSSNSGTSKRSFDRTFILIPAIPGSRAAAAGLPVSIINDSLSLRPYTNNSAWIDAVDPSLAPSNLPDKATLAQYKVANGLSDTQHAQVIQFALTTRLNYAFSLQCLGETAWSNEVAFQAFSAAKSQIPTEAFTI